MLVFGQVTQLSPKHWFLHLFNGGGLHCFVEIQWELECEAPSKTWPMAFKQPFTQWIFTEHLLHVALLHPWCLNNQKRDPSPLCLLYTSSITRTPQRLWTPGWMWDSSFKHHSLQIVLWSASRMASPGELWPAATSPGTWARRYYGYWFSSGCSPGNPNAEGATHGLASRVQAETGLRRHRCFCSQNEKGDLLGGRVQVYTEEVPHSRTHFLLFLPRPPRCLGLFHVAQQILWLQDSNVQ